MGFGRSIVPRNCHLHQLPASVVGSVSRKPQRSENLSESLFMMGGAEAKARAKAKARARSEKCGSQLR